MSVCVALTNASVRSVDQHFRALIAGYAPRFAYCRALCWVDRRRLVVTRSLDSPALGMWNNMLIFLAHFSLHMSFFIDNNQYPWFIYTRQNVVYQPHFR